MTSPISYYIGFSTFSISNGFLPGVNTLDFSVFNGPNGNSNGPPGNPTGLRVELSGTANPVPTPATWAILLMSGVVTTGLYRKRNLL
jgi:hypothetical protein